MSIELRTEELPILQQAAHALSQSKLCGHTQQDAYFVLVAGRELGLGPVASLRNIHVIDGKPSLGVHALTAVAMPHCEKWEVESDATRCRITCKRRGYPSEHTLEYTLDDAKRAGLDSRPNWKRMPREMLFARCASNLVRRVFPDLVAGVLSSEEAEDLSYEQPSRRVVVTPQPEGPDTSALHSAIKAAASIQELQEVAAKIKALRLPAGPERTALGDAYTARRTELEAAAQIAARPAVMDDAAWRAHLASKTNPYEVAASFLKRSAEFDAAGVLPARFATTCERLRALECVDPEEFIEAQAAKADARDAQAVGQ